MLILPQGQDVDEVRMTCSGIRPLSSVKTFNIISADQLHIVNTSGKKNKTQNVWNYNN